MGITITTIEEMNCSMGGCSNLVRDVGMREGEGVYSLEEVAIDAGWKIEEHNGARIHICPRCANEDEQDLLKAQINRLREVVPQGKERSWSMLEAVYAILYPTTEVLPGDD